MEMSKKIPNTDQLTQGRIVRYVVSHVGPAKIVYPAMVVLVGDHQKLTLCVFTPTGLLHRSDVARDDEGSPLTWHWPGALERKDSSDATRGA